MDEVLGALRLLLEPIYLEYAIEILIIYLLLYTFLRFMEGTRGEGILKGIALAILTVPMVVAITADQFEVLDRLLVITKFLGATAIPVLVGLEHLRSIKWARRRPMASGAPPSCPRPGSR